MIDIAFRTGALVDRGIAGIREAINDLSNLRSASAGVSVLDQATRYVQWVSTTESRLRNLLAEPSVWEGLYSERFWHLTKDVMMQVSWPLIFEAEYQSQRDRLTSLANEIERACARSSGGLLVVLDTNVLMHWKSLDEIDWTGQTLASEVRLVVPLRVIEELHNGIRCNARS